MEREPPRRRRGGVGRRGWWGRQLFTAKSVGSVRLSAPTGLRAAPPTGSPGPVAVDSPGPERPGSEAPAYVNIPVSPSSRRQLHYMGLELQEAGEGVRGGSLPCVEALTAWLGTAVEGRVTGLGSGAAQAAADHGLLSGAGVSLYAQIDIAATETAHRVGARHARAREEQLWELEQRAAQP
ncbi:hypothetical protein P7K49_005963 [Saguinus oedipus]|uniref:Uncharacterized protein n=1 Tax=Saguinus oedipus TaxID=9490 RepID=A0ABQ9W116_SAGOE|nr:hypothetical protein P7K49_005963 [Saguinus oedipus]